MILKAYIMAADPAWIENSVLSYYNIIDELIVSYDKNRQGWTGVPIMVDQCLERLQAIDRDKKMRFCPGEYARLDHTPIENDTYQRQCALDEAGKGADWVLQLDTDEVFLNTEPFIKSLQYAQEHNILAIEWPMRVLFQGRRDGHFLEVCASDGSDRFEYPGSIAVRPGAKLIDARRVEGGFLRPIVKNDLHSLQICRPAESNEFRMELPNDSGVIVHYSWIRSSLMIRKKLATWGHSQGWRSLIFYYRSWLLAPYLWRYMRDFHPFARGLWPALKISEVVSASVCSEQVAEKIKG